jgi:putative protease
VEVLSPAGNLEKLKYAIRYGADAVYAGSQDFSLRAKADNFDHADLIEAVRFCHENDKKLFVPLNIYAHNRHIDKIKAYIKTLAEAKVDAVIVSDMGVFDLVQSIAPDLPIHVSTQANITSYQAVNTFKKLGAKRVILARELTFSEIKEIREKCPDIELEIFVHGAMCISYSGRCLLSAFLSNRSANLGECTHPCRWKYFPSFGGGRGWFDDGEETVSLIEETRPDQSFPIDEDQHGFYFMNSKDLCLWQRLEEIYKAGIDSIKIEGRMKSIYYVAAVTRAYKQTVLQIEKGLAVDSFWREELDKVSHRIYTEGFFEGFEVSGTQNYETSTYTRDWQFVGCIVGANSCSPEETARRTGVRPYKVRSFHKITPTDEVEMIFPDGRYDMKLKDFRLFDENMNEIGFTKPNSCFYISVDKEVPEFGILRKRV